MHMVEEEAASGLLLCREAGWAGVAVAPGQPSQVALARHFPKDVTLFDGPVAVRSIHTMYCPTAVLLLSTQLAADAAGGPLVAVTEGPQVRRTLAIGASPSSHMWPSWCTGLQGVGYRWVGCSRGDTWCFPSFLHPQRLWLNCPGCLACIAG